MKLFSKIVLSLLLFFSCGSVAAQSNHPQVIYIDFDDGNLPAGWTVIDGYNDNKTWDIIVAQTLLGYPFSGKCMIVNSAQAVGAYMDETLISSFYDCSTMDADVYLSFVNFFYYNYQNQPERGEVFVRNGLSSGWQLVLAMAEWPIF